MVFVKHEISENQPCTQIFYAMFVRGYAKDSSNQSADYFTSPDSYRDVMTLTIFATASFININILKQYCPIKEKRPRRCKRKEKRPNSTY